MIIAICMPMAINSYLVFKTYEYCTALPLDLSGNPRVPKNSTQEQEEYCDTEVQWNTKITWIWMLIAQKKALPVYVYLWLHSKRILH